jgi:hypothetical protein
MMEPQVTDDSLFVAGPRKRGRPRVEEPLDQRVTIRMTTPEYDRLIKIALKHDEPVTGIVRSLLKLRMPR